MPGHRLSVIVITKNEERNIVECLQSVSWSDDIVVVDSKSTDKTVELAHRFTRKVYITDWMGYAGAKNYAIKYVEGDWILWLDADERVTPSLAIEIKNIVDADAAEFNLYAVARRAYFLGKQIKHCGWYPGYVVRLFKKNSAEFNTAKVHEKLDYQGGIGHLQNDLLHYTDDNLFHYFSKFNRYTSLAADELFQHGRRATIFDLTIRPPYQFFKMFILRRGFLDMMHGFILSLVSAAYVFVKYAKLWELIYENENSATPL